MVSVSMDLDALLHAKSILGMYEGLSLDKNRVIFIHCNANIIFEGPLGPRFS